MTEDIDAGKVIGQSAEFEVGDVNGIMPPDPMVFVERLGEELSWPAARVLSSLVKRHQVGLTGFMSTLRLWSFCPLNRSLLAIS